MTKILFLIHDLGHGGAEKVLVNLVNNMDHSKFDITVMALFGGGVNEQFLKPHIRYRAIFKHTFRGNSHVMKLFSPEMLHKWFIKERYDIEVSYLEGPSARIISGCPHKDTKLVSWIHVEQHTAKRASASFRSYGEALRCYDRFHRTVCVSEYVKRDFSRIYPTLSDLYVLYNTNETAQIIEKSAEDAPIRQDVFTWCGVGKLLTSKGFDRMIRIQKRLTDEGYNTHFYALGEGPQRNALEAMVKDLGCEESVTFLGYQTNPYKYVAKCDLFVCASHAEGFSTAATEALIVGTPVCTVEVSGMKEMLGSHNEYGIVTENDDEALYQGIKKLLDNPELLEHYRHQAALRGKDFRTEETVKAVEQMMLAL
ncbi:MAG: glycosyltransferase [Oscillospiraceae bacterium]|nr:glycosyltransferase [Oscillospiraceae bacterium]